MLRFAVRILLSIIIFTVCVNRISGAHFYGHGASEAFFLSLMMTVAAFVLWLLYYGFIIGTLGLGAFIAVPMRWLFQWLIPTLQLLLLSHWYPETLVFETGASVVITGLIFLVMHELTEEI